MSKVMSSGTVNVTSIVDRPGRRINLSNQGNTLDSTVLEALRGALQFNSFFIRLSFSHSRLNEDCITMLCALLKDPNYIVELEMDSCQLRDREFNLHLASAILGKKQLVCLDLSRNGLLSDASVGALSEMIAQLPLRELRLAGVSLTKKGGEELVKAMQSNSTLEVCDLPYTVGYGVLDEVALLLARNISNRHRREAQAESKKQFELLTERYASKSALAPREDDIDLTKTEREEIQLARYWGYGRKNALEKNVPTSDVRSSRVDLEPKRHSSLVVRQGDTNISGKTHGWRAPVIAYPPDPHYASLELRSDRAVSRSLELLSTLDHRARENEGLGVVNTTKSRRN